MRVEYYQFVKEEEHERKEQEEQKKRELFKQMLQHAYT